MASPTAAYSIRLRVRLDNRPGSLGRLATAIGDAGGNITAIGGFDVRGPVLEEDLVVNCRDEAHIEQVRAAAEGLEGCEVLEVLDRTFLMHDGGKIEVLARMPVSDRDDLSMAYTPGVARVCQAIAQDPQRVHDLTIKKNTVAIVSDGSAVLGLGRIGPEAALPVMEGKALLFKHFAGVDAFPICLDVGSAEEIVETVARIAPAFGGINLEDIAAPECFEVEERLKERLDIPVFHDDQHGTAIVTLAALENALKLVGKKMSDLRVVIAGVGAAGVAISKILLSAGVGEIIGVDRKGAIWAGRDDLNVAKLWFAERNPSAARLATGAAGSNVFIGVSGPGLVAAAELRTMAPDPIVFTLLADGITEADGIAAVIATGRHANGSTTCSRSRHLPGRAGRGGHVDREGMKLARPGLAACVGPTVTRPHRPVGVRRRVAPGSPGRRAGGGRRASAHAPAAG